MKFRIKDDDGRDYVVEELEEEKIIPEETKEPVKDDDETLSAEEIKSLRELIAVAPQLMHLLEIEKAEHAEDAEEEEEEIDKEDEDIIEDDDEEVEEKKEEILETKSHDSKKAFGAIEKQKIFVDDSLEDGVSDAWAKRYNGGNR